MYTRAFAKINIGLQIVGKRDDGYHDIDTIFHRINLFDTLGLRKTDRGISLSCSDPTIPTDESNLCCIAAKKLFDAVQYDGGVAISLEKSIPHGAGLGGGSADAAATLQMINELFAFELSVQQLAEIAVTIGADVPFFLGNGSAHATGIGDELSYFRCALPHWIVLACPQVHVSTPWAYKNLILDPNRPATDLRQTILTSLAMPADWNGIVRNDFEPAVFQRYPEIAEVKQAMYAEGAAFALMSGSGSAVFGIFESKTSAQHCSERLRANTRVWITEPGFEA